MFTIGNDDFKLVQIIRDDGDESTSGEVIFNGEDSMVPLPITIVPTEAIKITVAFEPTTTLPAVSGELLIESNSTNLIDPEALTTSRVNLSANGARACLLPRLMF